MNIGKALFAQLMDFLPWSTFARIVARYGGDARVRTLCCAHLPSVHPFIELPDLIVDAPPKLNGPVIASINAAARYGIGPYRWSRPTPIRQAEVGTAKVMLNCTEERFGLKPARLARTRPMVQLRP